MPQLEFTCTLQASIENAFDFIIRPDNIVDISQPDMGINVISGPDKVTEGSRVEFEITGIGMPQKLVHEYSQFREPVHFWEIQIEGPLQSMQHEHLFEEDAGGVIIIDRIEFEPPAGMLGFLLTEDRIAKH